jgi:hypothetical protein
VVDAVSAVQTIDPDDYDRIVKLEVDDGRAKTFAEAEMIVRGYRMQIAVGADVVASPAWQAGVLTAVNAGHRAMSGGVSVRIDDDPILSCGWATGTRLSNAVQRFGGTVVAGLSEDVPTMVLGTTVVPSSPCWVRAQAGQWWAGVAPGGDAGDPTTASTIAAALATALGVSECFQRVRGYEVATDRHVGVSLWDPMSDWRGNDAEGPTITELPGSAYILGLGHLGQAYLWLLGSSPHPPGRRHPQPR